VRIRRGEHNDLDVILKVDQYHKFSIIVNKNATATWEVVVDTSGIMNFGPSNLNSNRLEPDTIFRANFGHLTVITIKFSEHFDHFTLNLKFGFFCHERGEWH
jgi:hypothetical protein